MSGGPPEVTLADVDPELFAGLTAHERDEARVLAVAPTLTVERGRWDTTKLPVADPEACLLAADGRLRRRRDRTCRLAHKPPPALGLRQVG